MKCRNWRTEDPERPENPEEPEEPENPEEPERSGKIRNLRKPPEKARQGHSGKSGTSGKSQAQAAPHANICFLPQNHRLCADLFALPPRIYARNAARPCAADRKNAPASRRKSVSLRFPPEQAEGRSGTSGTSGKTGSSGNSGPPSARITPIICNLTYYNLRHNTPILIINNKLFALFLARFKIKPYLCIV